MARIPDPPSDPLSVYADLVALYPDNPVYLQRYAELLLERGQRTTAIEVLRRLHALLLRAGKEREAAQLVERWPEIGRITHPRERRSIGSLLPEDRFGGLWRRLHAQRLPEGARLLEQGAPARASWLVLEGRLAIYRRRSDAPPALVDFAEPGDVVGEQALIDATPNPGDVVASLDSVVLRLPRKRLAEAMAASPALGAAFAALADRRRLLGALAVHPAFGHAPLDVRRYLADAARLVRVAPRMRIRRAGEPMAEADLWLEGDAIFALGIGGRLRPLGPLRPGELIGEPPIGGTQTRAPADVIARSEGWLARLPPSALVNAIEAHAPLKEALLREAEAQREQIGRWVARLRAR